MNRTVLSASAMVVGLVLMLVGNWFQVELPVSAVWTNEQAQEYSKASADLHAAGYGAGHSHDQAHSHDAEELKKSAQYIAAAAAFDKVKADLNRAHSRQAWFKYGLIILGVMFATAGIIPTLLDKLKEAKASKSRGKPGKHPKPDHKPQKYFHP
jgi:hypothetical protein